MALVKTSKIAARPARAEGTPERPKANGPQNPKTRDRKSSSGPLESRLSERMAAATEELASGLTQASAAAEELRRSMEQIATGAEEAAGASQEQVAAIKSVVTNLTAGSTQADASRRRTEAAQAILAETTLRIAKSVGSIQRNAERQGASVEIIAELERRAQDIGDITRAVSRISDQTNLLALNAAIEAARAGDHGRGFAVVADEVRALAERADKSAREVQELAEKVQSDVRTVVETVRNAAQMAVQEAKAGGDVVETLDAMRADMTRMAQGSQDTLTAALQAERAAAEAQRGAEQVASAAEEQSAAASQAQSAIQQQAQSLDQAQVAARTLATLTEDLRTGQADASAAEQIGAASEELSATVQELSSAATQIMAAAEQINRGTQQQASATQQTSAALAEIESIARQAQKNATIANDRILMMETALGDSRASIERLVAGVSTSLHATRVSLSTITQVQAVGRTIEKIVDQIALITVQTSMLAVSGSVEAARAGSAGSGFAVVSNDIRNLAREASDSIERGKDTVRGILDQVASVRRDVEQIVSSAEIEVRNNQAVFDVLDDVEREVAAVSTSGKVILQVGDAILGSTGEIATGARQIAAAAEEASAASRQAATASTQQAQGAEDLAAAVEEIASLADELKQQNG